MTHLKNRNNKLRDYNLNKGSTQKDFKLREALDTQYKEAGQVFMQKKIEFDKLIQIISKLINFCRWEWKCINWKK